MICCCCLLSFVYCYYYYKQSLFAKCFCYFLFRKLSDIDNDGSLTLQEFIVAMKLVLIRRQGYDIPVLLPDQLNNITHYKQGIIFLNFKKNSI